MAWYNFKKEVVEEKLNPAQPHMANVGNTGSNEPVYTYTQYYEQLEIVNRGVNMLVDDSAEIPTHVGDQTKEKGVQKGLKQATVDRLINRQPNPFQDINTFKRNLMIDMLLDGNIFIYFDGADMYHLPANKVKIETSSKTYVKGYTFNGEIKYKPSEIIHVKENSFASIYRGVPRLRPALRTMQLLGSMRAFQDNFFKNGAVPGLVIKSPNTLSMKIKERLLQSWSDRYRPDTGGRRPLILDGGLEVDALSKVNFRELDFQNAIEANEKIVLKALGIPPILMDSGNNANIRPNMRLYYVETVLPIVRKLNFALERYFGFHITEDLKNTPAMQPELKDQSDYYTSLVNGGIITAAEAREKLGFCECEGENKERTEEIRIPANIAGSAANPSEGGRPPKDDDK